MPLANQVEGLRSVSGSTERDFLFPLPTTGQKVYNQSSRGIEEWGGAAWSIILGGGGAVNVLSFLALGDGATDDLAAFKRAVAATPEGGTLWIPRTASFYKIVTTGGQTNAILIDKRMTLLVDGIVEASYGAIETNPATIFRITADRVSLTGNGTIRGDGTIVDGNTGTEEQYPSLVRVEGDRFTMHGGICIETPQKIGVYLWDCEHAKITGCDFTGGPTTYSDTAYFAIRLNQGGRHLIADNQFYPDADGGMFVSCIFGTGTNQNTISNNKAKKPYEKLFYLNGNDNTASLNEVLGSTTTIPGTTQTGTVGPCYRMDGVRNKCVNNYSRYGGGFQGIAGGAHCDISGNTFLDCGQSGITISGGSAKYDNLSIRNNIITCGDLAGVAVNDGIVVQHPAFGVAYNVQVKDNAVTGFSKSDPLVNITAWQASHTYAKFAVTKPTVSNTRYYEIDTTYNSGGISAGSEPNWALAATPGQTIIDGGVRWICRAYETASQIRLVATTGNEFSRAQIAGNTVMTGERGLSTTYMINSVVRENLINCATQGITETNGGTNRYRHNPVDGGGASAISGLAATSIADTPVDWTPVLADGSAHTATMGSSSSNAATMVRDGRKVKVQGQIAVTSLTGSGTVSGAVRITGLPVACATGLKYRAPIKVGLASGVNITAGQSIAGFIDGGNAYIELYLTDATGGMTALQASEFSATGVLVFELEYLAAAE